MNLDEIEIKSKEQLEEAKTTNESIKKFCGTMAIECITFEHPALYLGLHRPLFIKPYPLLRGVYRVIRSGYRLLKSIYQLIKLKKILDSLLRKNTITKDDNLIFFTSVMSYDVFYLAKEFSCRGNVYIKDIAKGLKAYTRKSPRYFNYWDIIILRGGLKLILQLNLILYDLGWKITWGIDEGFLKKYHIEQLSIDKDYRAVQLDVMNNMKIIEEEYDHIIVGQYPGVLLWVTYDSFEEMYKKLVGLKTEFILKMHPSVREGERSEKTVHKYFSCWERLPDYIPVELVLRNIRKTVLSIDSDALLAAAEFKHLKAISLLELVEWKDGSWKTWCKNNLIKKSNNRIIFPRDFNELERLISQ